MKYLLAISSEPIPIECLDYCAATFAARMGEFGLDWDGVTS